MPSLDRRGAIRGIAILGLCVFIAVAALSRDGHRTTLTIAAPSDAGIVPTELMIASPTNEQADEAAVRSAEADPASFDGAALETWWENYLKKHPAR